MRRILNNAELDDARAMSPHLPILVSVLLSLASAAPKEHEAALLSCQEFSRGVQFEDEQAVGTWILLRLKTENVNSIDNTHCLDFFQVADKERKDLEISIGKYVENLSWKNLTLKMQIPCARAAGVTGASADHSAAYYLERLGADGSYRTLQMPPATAKLDLASFHRYSMRLKMQRGKADKEAYLGMLDCHDRVGFLLGRQPDDDARLQALAEAMFQPASTRTSAMTT